MKGKIYTLGKNEKCPDGAVSIDVTSRSDSWGRGLSPFILGPCECSLDNCRSWNVENAWQYSKVYSIHDDNGEPNAEWYRWAIAGFSDEKAHRYPMKLIFGKSEKPLYSWYRGKKYSYVEARKKIYIPLYARAAAKSAAYAHIKAMLEVGVDVAMRDFDGYRIDSLGITHEDLVNNDKVPLGHSFVIWMMLTGAIKEYVPRLEC